MTGVESVSAPVANPSLRRRLLWLRRKAECVCRCFPKAQLKYRQPNVDSFEDILVEPSESTDKHIQLSVEAKEAAAAMKDLRPEQRQILHLSIIQGFSHQEIADALEMPLGTVKTHARRGLIQVRELLGLDNTGNLKEVSA